jgi:hypothetical protein
MKPLLRLILVPVCTAVSAALTGWLARHFPGVGLPAKDLTALMVTGGLAGAGSAIHWLSRQPKVVHLADEAKLELEKLRAELAANTALTAPISEIEQTVKAHADQVVAEMGQLVHAPQSIVSLVESIVNAMDGQKPAAPAAVVEPAPLITGQALQAPQ